MASLLRQYASTSTIRPWGALPTSRASLRLRAQTTSTTITPTPLAAAFEAEIPHSPPVDSATDGSGPPPPMPPPSGGNPDGLELPTEWAEQVAERHRRKLLMEMFQPLGSSQNRETAFQAFHSSNRPISPSELTLSALMAAGAHLGHTKQRTRPAYMPLIYGRRANMNIIDLDHTLVMFRRAANFVRMTMERGGLILFVGTHEEKWKKISKRAAERIGDNAYHVSDKWTPGTFTNAANMLTKQIFQGDYLPDVAVFLNAKRNLGALRECHVAMIPTIGIIDTDTDPRIVTYAIPANDESVRTVELVAGVLSVAAREGRQKWDMMTAQQEARQQEREARRATWGAEEEEYAE